MKQHSGAPLLGRLMGLSTNISLICTGLPRTNALRNIHISGCKKFGPWSKDIFVSLSIVVALYTIFAILII
jgi:hypothetical protein